VCEETFPSTYDTNVLVDDPLIFGCFKAKIKVSDIYHQIIKEPSSKKSRILYLSRKDHPVNTFYRYITDNWLWGLYSYNPILEKSRIQDIKTFVNIYLSKENKIFLNNLSQGIVYGVLRFNDDDMYNKYMESESKKQMESGLDSNDDFFTEAEEKSIRRLI
jgi:hypothetical protein